MGFKFIERCRNCYFGFEIDLSQGVLRLTVLFDELVVPCGDYLP